MSSERCVALKSVEYCVYVCCHCGKIARLRVTVSLVSDILLEELFICGTVTLIGFFFLGGNILKLEEQVHSSPFLLRGDYLI